MKLFFPVMVSIFFSLAHNYIKCINRGTLPQENIFFSNFNFDYCSLFCIDRNERQRVIVGLIEETSRRVLEDSHRRHWDSMMRQWHTHKQHILNTLVGQLPQQTFVLHTFSNKFLSPCFEFLSRDTK